MSDQPNSPPPRNGGSRDRVPLDPWEARERERARYNRSASGKRNNKPQTTEEWLPSDFALRENFTTFGLLITIALLIVSGMARVPEATRYFLLQVGAFLALLLLGTNKTFQERVLPALLRPPTLFILLLTLWTGIQFWLSPFRNFAATELLRVVSGVSIYFIAAFTLKAPRQISYVIAGVLAMASLVSLIDLSEAGRQGGHPYMSDLFSLLGTHEHIGSVLTLLLPMALVFALHPEIEEKRRLSAVASALILGVALLSSRSRSGWLATAFAGIVLTILFFRFVRPRAHEDRGSRHQPLWQRLLMSPMSQVGIALVVFIAITNLAPLVSQRASLLNALDDAAFTGRLTVWQGAKIMIGQHPWIGSGLGSYPVLQGQYTHVGDDTVLVLTKGTTHDNNAHNYYLQWTAETGIIGLFLHVAVVASFVITVLMALPRATSPFQTALLCGSLGGILASMVDSLSSPMYHFAGIWAIQYAWMGLGIAALRPLPRSGRSTPAPYLLGSRALSAPIWVGGIASGAVVGLSMLFWVWQARQIGAQTPRGSLAIIAEPVGPVARGTTVHWRAVFTDADGTTRATMPGTIWNLIGDSAVEKADQELLDLREGDPLEEGGKPTRRDPGPRQSIFSVLVPTGAKAPIRVKAAYRDRYGRIYEAWSEKEVR